MNKFNTIPQAPITKEFIKSYLPENPIIIEAGAHIGRDTIKMSKLWPEGIIYAFEPVPELFNQLNEKASNYTNIRCYQLALSSLDETKILNVSKGATTAASSFLQPKEYIIDRPNVFYETIEVQAVNLDKWVKDNNIKKIDFLWLDLQGFELIVLKSSPKVLSQVKALLVEVSLTERFENNPLYYELRSWIESQDFTAICEDLPKHNKINIFFVNKKNLKRRKV